MLLEAIRVAPRPNAQDRLLFRSDVPIQSLIICPSKVKYVERIVCQC